MQLLGIFKDGMVLQRDREVVISGVAEGLVSVDAAIKEGNRKLTKGTAEVDKNGKFVIKMDAIPAGGPYKLVVEGGLEKIVIANVYMGELWVAAGADNMKMPLRYTEGSERASKLIDNDKLHYYVVPTIEEENPNFAEAEKDTEWVLINSTNAGNISGTAFYFALELMTKVDCHIGIIEATENGTNLSCWQSIKALKSSPEGYNYINEWETLCGEEDAPKTSAEFNAVLKNYNIERKYWEKDYDRTASHYKGYAYDEVTTIIGQFRNHYPVGRWSCRRPGAMFDQKIMRIAPTTVAGVLLYQGEADCDTHADDYFSVFMSLINEWRLVFGNAKLPIVYCQLHMWIDRNRKFIGLEDYKWPRVRQAQYLAYKATRDTYMAILSDVGQFDNPNPVDKATTGKRMAYLALKNIYGFKEVAATAPYLIDVRSTNGGVEMSFAGDFTMLIISGYGETGFQICGKDGEFYDCEASVDFDGKTVSCFSPYVLEPATVRYAYFSYGSATLSSDTGLAVLPFTRNVIKGLNDLY